MINREVLRDAVYNSMKEKTFHTVVNTAFVNAIPIDKSELDSTTRRGLAKYSFDALEAAGGFGLLDNAIKNETNPIKKSYLQDIKEVCCESAMEVANRVTSEYVKANSPSLKPSTEAFNATMKENAKKVADRTAYATKKIGSMTINKAKSAANKTLDTTKKIGQKTAYGIDKMATLTAQKLKDTTGKVMQKVGNNGNTTSKESAIAFDIYRSRFVDDVNASSFKSLVNIGKALESADLNDQIEKILAKGIRNHEELMSAEYGLRKSICQEAASCFETISSDAKAMESFVSDMQAMESTTDIDHFLEAVSAAVEGDLEDEINGAEDELAGDNGKNPEGADDPEYEEMMKAKKAHQNGEDKSDDSDDDDDTNSEEDVPEVKPSDVHPDKFDNAMSDNTQPPKPDVIRHGVPLQKLVADAKMTDEEFERFASRLDRLDVPAVTNIVNDRVITAMKAEKETYQLNDAANQRLKDAITDSKDNDLEADPMPENQANSEPKDEGDLSKTTFDEPAPDDQVDTQPQQDNLATTDKEAEEIKESVLSLALRNKTRDHVSVYSKIQSAAIESLLSYGVSDFSKINFDLLEDITLESTFDIFPNKTEKSFSEKMRNIMGLKAATESFNIDEINKEDLMTVGTAMCTIIFTLLQTLHTMNLVKITPTMAKTMCDAPSPVSDPKVVNDVNTQASAALEEHKRGIIRMDNVPDLENAITNICSIQQQINAAKAKGSVIDPKIESSLEAVLNMAKVKKDRLKAALDGMDVKESALLDRYVDMDIASMNTAARSFRNTPVDHVQFICTESVSGDTFVNIVGLKDRRPVKETSAVINNHRCARNPGSELALESYLGVIVNKSNMATVGATGKVANKTLIIDGRSKSL